MQYDIIRSKRQKNGIIIHEMEDGSKSYFADIRGGLSWPDLTTNTPAYYCVLGQEYIACTSYEKGLDNEGSLRLLAEYKSESILAQSTFFRRLTDDSQRLYCQEFYTTDVECPGNERDPKIMSFERYRSENRIDDPFVTLRQASFVDDLKFPFVETGVRRELGKISILENSILHQQLMATGPEDLKDSVGFRFNAIHAYRYALASFFKSPPNPGVVFTPRRQWRQHPANLSRYI